MKTCKYIVLTDGFGELTCDLPCEGRTDYCGTHNRMLRKEESDKQKAEEKRKALLSKPKKVYAKPNKISDKRKELNKEYFILVEQFKKDNPYCKAKVNEYCSKVTSEPHHRKGRGKYLLDISTWLPVCRNCHTYIENFPNIAREKGWSESRLAKQEPHKI